MLALLAPSLMGCGGSGRPSLIKVTGTVTLDGVPLEGAIIAFQPITDAKAKFQRPSAGVTDASGKFELGTYAIDDGAPIGKYKVGILKREMIGSLPEDYNSEMESETDMAYKWITPRSLASPETSNLQAEITSSGLSPAQFDLKSSAEPEIQYSGPSSRAAGP
jgi:hypothetical protein